MNTLIYIYIYILSVSYEWYDSTNGKNSIINDIIKVWESASIPIINKYSISDKFDIFLINLNILKI